MTLLYTLLEVVNYLKQAPKLQSTVHYYDIYNTYVYAKYYSWSLMMCLFNHLEISIYYN